MYCMQLGGGNCLLFGFWKDITFLIHLPGIVLHIHCEQWFSALVAREGGIGRILTFPTMHHFFFSLSLSPVAASKHIQYYITFFSHSWRCHTEALRFWKRSISQVLRTEVPQPIHHALCANDRFMHKRHHKQCEAAGMKRSESTVNGCDLKDCKAVIRIFNQRFRNSSCYWRMKGFPHIFLNRHAPSSVYSSMKFLEKNKRNTELWTSVWIQNMNLQQKEENGRNRREV